ncbi:hypothetical protein ES707_08421 [subsurface metagenome]
MKFIGQGRLAAAVALAAILGVSGVASAQQQTPDNQNQQNAPPNRIRPLSRGPAWATR